MKFTNSTLFTLLAVCLLFASNSFAQKPDIKFGKVSKEELSMNHYSLDSGASAVILADIGRTTFNYTSHSGFQIVFERHVRIKFFDQSGYDWANFEIPLYSNNGDKEKLTKLKAYTFNLNEKGKIEKTLVKKKHTLSEKKTDNTMIEKFTMPAVKQGSVIDVTYAVTSDFIFSLEGWQFQHEIPVVWSEYQVEVPEYFYYQKQAQGYIPFVINKTISGTGTLPGSAYTTASNTYTTHGFHWAAQNVPAFKEEAYMTTPGDYISKIDFQLSTIKWPNEPIENVLNSWDNIGKELMDHSDFGLAMKRTRFLNNIVEQQTAGLASDEEIITTLHSWVTNNISWNNQLNFLASSKLSEVYEKRTGNSADINLMLTEMLQKAGLQAYPVVLSTRSNGRLIPAFPMINQLNNVITLVKIGEGYVLLDATNKFNPIGQLPYYCLNGQGLMIQDKGVKWVNLRSGEKRETTTQAVIRFTEDMNIQINQRRLYSSISASGLREEIVENGEEKYEEELAERFENWDIEDFSIENLTDLSKPLKRSLALTTIESSEEDIIYLDLLYGMNVQKENPFTKESRMYPINYGCPQSNRKIVSIQIPEGYEVEELPEGINTALPGRQATYILTLSKQGNMIQVMSDFAINKDLFLPSEYTALKEFYNMKIAKEAQKIVLKKISSQATATN